MVGAHWLPQKRCQDPQTHRIRSVVVLAADVRGEVAHAVAIVLLLRVRPQRPHQDGADCAVGNNASLNNPHKTGLYGDSHSEQEVQVIVPVLLCKNI